MVKEDGSIKNIPIRGNGATNFSTQTLAHARVYENQAAKAEHLVRVIDSALKSVDRRQAFIEKYKMLHRFGPHNDGGSLMRELKDLVGRATEGHTEKISYIE